MQRQAFSILAGCLMAMVTTVSTVHAQFSSSIEGTVSDSAGATVAGATVTLTNTATGIKTTLHTTAVGYYLFPTLAPAIYNFEVAAQGFKTSRISQLELELGGRRTINTALEIGSQTTEVTVTAEAVSVDLSEVKLSSVVEQRQLADLPIAGRSFIDLATLMPGVTGSAGPADVFGGETQVNINIAGSRGEQNGFTVDSGTVSSMVRHGRTNLEPSAESIQEVQVTVNNFSAEVGNDAGGTIKVLTKSGTNKYHGSMSWFHQDNALTSRTVFQNTRNPLTGRVLPVSRRNEAAGSIGGPLIKNRTFIFGSFDVLRQISSSGSTTTVETPEFSSYAKTAFPNNKSAFLLKTYPSVVVPATNFKTAGSLTGTNCNNLATPSTTITTPVGSLPCNMNVLGDGVTPITTNRDPYQYNIRVDHMLTSKDRLYVNSYRNMEVSFSGSTNRTAFSYQYPVANLYGNLNETHTFSSSLVNEFRMTALRVHGEIACTECQIPTIVITGMNGFGIGGPVPFIQNNYEWVDTLSWVKGRHSLKAGFQISRLQSNWKPTPSYQRPGFTFNNVWDFVNDNPFSENNIGFNPINGSVYTPDTAERQHTESVFLQDSWKVRPNFTINYGLRWEAYGTVNEATLGNNVVWQTGTDTWSRIADGKNVTSSHILSHGDWNNFGPRISFAWDPTRNGKTSIHAGFGVFYDFLPSQLYGGAHFTPPIYMIVTASQQTAPLLPLYAFCASATDPFQCPQPAGLGKVIGLDSHNGSTYARSDITWIDPDLKSSYTMTSSFGIQQALGSTLTAEVNFMSSQGRKLYAKYNVNRFNGDLIQNNGVLKRINPSFGAIDYGQANFTSEYTGVTASVRQRFNHGLMYQVGYTMGHAIDLADGFGGGLPMEDPWNLKLDRAFAGYDVRQKLALAASYGLPTPGIPSRLVRSATKDWQVSGVATMQSGQPFSVTCSKPFAAVKDSTGKIIGNSGCDYNADGLAVDRPMAPSYGSALDMSRAALLTGVMKTADFAAPALGQFGNLGRDTFRNPGGATTNLSLLRYFHIRERWEIQFRAEAFNAFNRVNLGVITSDLANASFGRVTSAGAARRFQFGLRVSY